MEFLRDVNMGERPPVGRRVAVIGGGSVAMDAARTALRLQEMAGVPRDVTLVYRRSPAEMPAYSWEVLEGDEEGLAFLYLTAPARVVTDATGTWRGWSACSMELGEPDDSGRRRPVPDPRLGVRRSSATPSSRRSVSRSTSPGSTARGSRSRRGGTIIADPFDFQTANPKVFAGGDAVRGPATLIEAIGDGQRAAFAIERCLTGRAPRKEYLDEVQRRDGAARAPSAPRPRSRRAARRRFPTCPPTSG